MNDLKGNPEKKDLGRLPAAARAYIGVLSAGCVAVLFASGSLWTAEQTGHFLFYLICGILCSNLKVHLPGITGTLSVNFLFILASVVELSLPQTVAVGCTSGVVQLFCAAKRRPRMVQVWFTFSSMAVCTALTFAFDRMASGILESLAFRLFWAALAYFLCNTVSVATIISLTEGKRLWVLWKENFFWTGPHYLVGAAIVAIMHLCNRAIGWQSGVLVIPVVYLLYYSYHLYLRRLEQERRHVSEMADLHLRTIEALALAIDAKDGTTHDHLRRVQIYAREIARELGLPEEERRALDAASLLHDIGKLAVPEHIISKPGRLAPEEFEKMKIHPIVGAEILESVRFPDPVVPIVRSHHEKWDGSGYPDGLKGEQIPMGARILAAVDCLDALASDRQYRRALPLEQALQRVVAESGRSFDPKVVEVLQKRCAELESIALTQSPSASRLSTSVRVEKGSSPAAGFEQAAPAAAPASRRDFITSIAAARQEFQMLLELTNELGSSLRVDETLALLASRLKPVIPHHGIAIYTVKGSALVTQYAAGDNAPLFSSLEIPIGQGLSGWVVQNNRPIVNGNPSVEPGYLNDPAKFSTLRSAISVPLSGIAGVIGALTLYHRDGNAFTRDHLRVLQAVSSKAGLTIENALRFVQAEKTAVTDELTGLPNARSLFLELDSELDRATRNQAGLAVLVLDMDGFKQVNDRFGHTVGNKVLQLTAEALRGACRQYDYAARMGGDEFVLLMPEIEPEALEERIRQLNDLVMGIGRRVCGTEFLSLSAGAAFYPEDGADAEQLLSIADARMYETKRAHHSRALCGIASLAAAVAPSDLVSNTEAALAG
jgi:diguanylate cyclase (GGDEF)-like protein/putative nucleotidyltransferase with HDIG domain